MRPFTQNPAQRCRYCWSADSLVRRCRASQRNAQTKLSALRRAAGSPDLVVAAVLFALLAASLAAPAAEGVKEAWVKRYSNIVSNAQDRAMKVVTDAHGDIIVIGATDNGVTGADMLTIKYSGADGSLLWSQRYNSPGNGDDYANAVVVDGSGNVVVTGGSYNSSPQPNLDYYTVKYAAVDGTLLWQQSGGSAIAVDGSGNVVVTGNSTVKYAAADGALLWEQRHTNGFGSAVALDASGNVVVMGSSYYTAKYAAADGALIWEKRGPGGGAISVAVDGSGNAVVTGSSLNDSGSDYDYYTTKHAGADGALLWEQRHQHGRANAVAVDVSGNVVVTGSSVGTNGLSDYYTIKYAAVDGALLWERRYNDPDDRWDEAVAVAVDASGDVVVTGATFGSDNYTAKYASADGALLWERRYSGSGHDPTGATQAVAVDSIGDVVVTGSSLNDNGDDDIYTAKYAGTHGSLLWEQRFNGPVDTGNGNATAVAADARGDVVVTGSSYNGSGNFDYYTAKYSGASGGLLWEERYNGPANANDMAIAVLLDASGNAIVTGYSSNGTNDDYYTAKYAASDGVLLWEQRYDGPAYGDDQPVALALDASGNVVVSGTSVGIESDWDYYTAKYSAADGALLWERRYNSPANREDKAAAVAVDASGNVVVTGNSFNAQEFWLSDYYTAKYASADGALLWEQRSGPLHGRDRAQAVAVDAAGNVVVAGHADFSYWCEEDACGGEANGTRSNTRPRTGHWCGNSGRKIYTKVSPTPSLWRSLWRSMQAGMYWWQEIRPTNIALQEAHAPAIASTFTTPLNTLRRTARCCGGTATTREVPRCRWMPSGTWWCRELSAATTTPPSTQRPTERRYGKNATTAPLATL